MQPRSNEIYSDHDIEQSFLLSSSKTTLQRTELTSQDKVLFSANALAREREHGSKSELARLFEVSRPTVYSAIGTASSVLTKHFDDQKSKAVMVEVDEAQLRRAVVALRVMAPNALRPIEELIPIVYPGVHISYGKVQQMVSEAEQKARELNSKMDMSKIEASALDEMFSQGAPVLGGVDLDSGALFALALRESRAAEDWAEVLQNCKEQGLNLQTVVKDAAKGIEAGAQQVYPEAEQRDDCFHAHYEMGKVRRILEQRAYGAIAREEEAKQNLNKLRKTGRGEKRSKLVRELVVASRRCRQAIELHDTFEEAMHMAQEAMEIVDLKGGQLRTAAQNQAAIEQAAGIMMGLDERKCRKVGKYLRNRAPGLVKYMVQLHEQLAHLAGQWGQTAVSAACVFWRLVHELRHKRFRCGHKRLQHERYLLEAYRSLCDATLCQADREAIVGAVDAIFERRHRASSAIEGFNAALRPFLYVHKGVTQGFLDLFRAYYNLRTRRWGRHKGTSAHECLTGERVEDWLSLLGYPPKAASN
jgi:hypothetical protein